MLPCAVHRDHLMRRPCCCCWQLQPVLVQPNQPCAGRKCCPQLKYWGTGVLPALGCHTPQGMMVSVYGAMLEWWVAGSICRKPDEVFSGAILSTTIFTSKISNPTFFVVGCQLWCGVVLVSHNYTEKRGLKC